MLTQSDFPIEDALEYFTRAGVEAAFFVPTETALRKAIIDAHESLRAFLRRQDIHDYSSQPKGSGNRVLMPARLIGARGESDAQISLYRPETKNGDPRFWVHGLALTARPGNLFALFVGTDGSLVAANLSGANVWASRFERDSPLARLTGGTRLDSNESDLMSRLRSIADRGYISSMRGGDTGIGFTLESLLGIEANSSKQPDYKGIELKASRSAPLGGRPRNRVTLFSQVPDWSASPTRTSLQLVKNFGYFDPNGRRGLYCTTSNRPNPQSLYLEVGEDGKVRCMSAGPDTREVLRWDLARLEARLQEKHASTFWVKADAARDPRGVEHFHYRQVVHSRKPILANLGPLIHTGKVTLDFTLHLKPNGRTRDHGYLFRMDPRNLELLFPPPKIHDLAGAIDFVFSS